MPTPLTQRLPRDFFDTAEPFKLDGVYCKLIPLTRGQFALVWLEHYERLSKETWCAQWNPCTRSFYAARQKKISGRRVNLCFLMHREILGLAHGDKRQSDHALHVTLDNRPFAGEVANLRIASQEQNKCNKRKYRNNLSGFKGIRLTASGKYEARIRKNGILRGLGHRDTAEAAHRELYVPAALKLHGEFARVA